MGKSVVRITKPPAPVPPLRDGDRMDANEFWRRYEADPEVFRAELIKGVVHLISVRQVQGEERVVAPISNERHSDPHADIIFWLRYYAHNTPGTRASAPTTLRSRDADSAPEPDAALRILPDHGGQTTTDGRGFLVGAPELLAEISHTTARLDLGDKFEVYQADGVREYLVWQTRRGVIDWFRLNRAGRLVAIPADAGGVVRSRVFPGLWLDAAAMASGRMDRVLAALEAGLAAPEHAAFVEKLRKAAARKKR